MVVRLMVSAQFAETVKSEEAKELVEDGYAEIAAALVADYDAGEMPMPEVEDFGPAFKKYIKVQTEHCCG